MIRKTTYPRTHLSKKRQFLYTPIEFRMKHPFPYPVDNAHEFERWFFDNTLPDEITGREYLPIFWTAYWVSNNYGTKEKGINNMQRFIDSLPRDKKYFTICQYDDGPIVDFKDLDIIVFGMSGGRIDYPIPLLCQPHGYKFNCERDIFASFVGGDTHPIRKELVKQFAGKKDCLVSLKKVQLKEYCNIMARSVFALCPRGYGMASFRIQEAMQYSTIPVYISDNFVEGFRLDFNTYGIKINCADIQMAYSILRGITPDQIISLRNNVGEIYSRYYTYEYCKMNILKYAADC